MSRALGIALALVLALCAWLYSSNGDLKKELAVAEEVAWRQQETISALRRSMEKTDEIVAAWDKDRTTLANVRSATRAAVKEAMKDESFKAWADAPVHPDAWRLLMEAATGSGLARPAAAGPDAAGAGTAPSGKRQ